METFLPQAQESRVSSGEQRVRQLHRAMGKCPSAAVPALPHPKHRALGESCICSGSAPGKGQSTYTGTELQLMVLSLRGPSMAPFPPGPGPSAGFDGTQGDLSESWQREKDPVPPTALSQPRMFSSCDCWCSWSAKS